MFHYMLEDGRCRHVVKTKEQPKLLTPWTSYSEEIWRTTQVSTTTYTAVSHLLGNKQQLHVPKNNARSVDDGQRLRPDTRLHTPTRTAETNAQQDFSSISPAPPILFQKCSILGTCQQYSFAKLNNNETTTVQLLTNMLRCRRTQTTQSSVGSMPTGSRHSHANSRASGWYVP